MENNVVLQVGVKAILQNEKGEYLLLRRSSKKYPEIAGQWDIAGGRIESGKTLIDNLQREISEETGLELVGTPKLLAAQDILRNAGRHVVRLTYLAKVKGNVRLDKKEHDAYKWYNRDELISLKNIDEYLKELIERKLF